MTTREHPESQPRTSPGARRRQQHANDHWQQVKLAWRAAGRRLPALRSDFAWFAGIQVDRVRLRFLRLRSWLTESLLALVAVSVVFAIAAWLLATGVAGGVGELFGGNVWLGQAATGATCMLLLAVGLGGGHWLRTRGRLRRLVRRHARLAGDRIASPRAGDNHAE